MTPTLEAEDIGRTLRPWLIGRLCPWWLDRVTDPAGGFFEAVDADGKPVIDTRKTTLVQARLTYVFSHAALLSGDPRMRAAADHGFAFLTRACGSGDEGWCRSVENGGRVLDETRDAYDQAFVLFAMAWHGRAAGDPGAIAIAEATYRFMERRLADPTCGGFLEEYLPSQASRLPRRQNPHMHLLEAVLALYETTKDDVWLTRAAAMVDLFRTSFVDRTTGALIEFFAADWLPAAGAIGSWREPGHQFEWVWLLFEYFRHTRDRAAVDDAERLYEFGMRFGVDRMAGVPAAAFDGVDAGGQAVADTKTLWPQTELVKACVARHEWLADAQALPMAHAHLGVIARHFLKADGTSWHNQITRDGTPIEAPTPARVLYHLFLAAAEVERVGRVG